MKVEGQNLCYFLFVFKKKTEKSFSSCGQASVKTKILSQKFRQKLDFREKQNFVFTKMNVNFRDKTKTRFFATTRVAAGMLLQVLWRAEE